MKSFRLLNCCCLLMLLAPCAIKAQKSGADSLYIDYAKLLKSALSGFIQSSSKEQWKQSVNQLQESVSSLREDMPAAEYIATLKGSTEPLSDEKIYSTRKNNVFMMAQFSKGTSDADTLLTFYGTAFAISEDGVCVTNYHVLKELIIPSQTNNTLVYIIIGGDKKVYMLTKILAYSRNNDLAIFKVNTLGARLSNPIPLGRPALVGAATYCISNPGGQPQFFSKGLVARNIVPDSTIVFDYSSYGATPVRMEITAEYGVGSSGGPILDKSGNVIGIVATTRTLHLSETGRDGTAVRDAQMVFRGTIPVKILYDLLKHHSN